MLELNTTTTMLLDGLHDPANDDAWEVFDRRYRPIVLAFARRLGLDQEDAADVAQETMTRFLQEYREGRYDRQRGRLRTWLVTLCRYRVAAHYRSRSGRREVAAASALVDLSDAARLTSIWDEQCRVAMLREALTRLQAASRVQPRTLQAFELLVVRQLPVAAVADELGISHHDVYLAKSRVSQRLRAILEQIEAVYEDA